MAKHIVVCSDGTGNSDVKGRGTNVFKLFEAVDLNGHRGDPRLVPQLALYDDGVGTENFRPVKLFAGATGFGLSRNVCQLYKELARIYDPGDRIFLFGFSRGAFTVRTLVGFIATCGLVDVSRCPTARQLRATVSEAYGLYRQRYRTALGRMLRGEPDKERIAAFRQEHCIADEVKIAFLGVWDTVDAVGLPFHLSDVLNKTLYQFKFPDHGLNPVVERACHALAIDDTRHSFHPLVWDEGERDGGRIEQVWFAGAHSNVGGGYPKQGMSLVALDWMMAKAAAAGLRFIGADRALYRDRATVDDKLYDPRAGAGVFYRWKLRDVARLCRKSGMRPTLHVSVLERVAHGTEDYTPGNLPPNATIAITPTGDPDQDLVAATRAAELETALAASHADGQSLMSHVRQSIQLGLLSYYLYVGALVGVPIAAWATGSWALLAGGLGGAFLASYFLAMAADTRMSAVFSQFWHTAQPDLRTALKRARRVAAEALEAPGDRPPGITLEAEPAASTPTPPFMGEHGGGPG